MAKFFAFFPPSGGGVANASVGLNGATAPSSSTLVAGEGPTGLQSPLQTDADGHLLVAADAAKPFHVIVDSSALPTGAASAANQSTANGLLTDIRTNTSDTASGVGDVQTAIAALSDKSASALVSEPYDYQLISYVPSGNGVGEIQTVVYKLGGASGTLVATLTLAYDAQNRLQSVTRS